MPYLSHLRMIFALTLARYRASAIRIRRPSERTREAAACSGGAQHGVTKTNYFVFGIARGSGASCSISKAFPFRTSAGRLRAIARGGLVTGVEAGQALAATHLPARRRSGLYGFLGPIARHDAPHRPGQRRPGHGVSPLDQRQRGLARVQRGWAASGRPGGGR